VSQVLDQIAGQRILPVLRTADADDAVATGRVLARSGMSVIELTRSTPDVEAAARELTGDGLVVGLGTVTRAEQVLTAGQAGVSFVVSFAAPAGIVSAAHEAGLQAIPGALTPGEVMRCLDGGADAVKLFPARVLEPSYLRDLQVVMPGLRAIVTGGLSAKSAGPWLEAGALAVGLGSELGSVASHGADHVEERARAALSLCR
jgi:2-dehydro-3-deoxyphosphogluconate aldolase/(4S)-4-hydroxy-2-oxoglutarate aldolase